MKKRLIHSLFQTAPVNEVVELLSTTPTKGLPDMLQQANLSAEQTDALLRSGPIGQALKSTQNPMKEDN